jgi:hypothetical protein
MAPDCLPAQNAASRLKIPAGTGLESKSRSSMSSPARLPHLSWWTLEGILVVDGVSVMRSWGPPSPDSLGRNEQRSHLVRLPRLPGPDRATARR